MTITYVQILTILYLMLGSFIAGMFFQEEIVDDPNKYTLKKKFRALGSVLFFMFCGPIVFGGVVLHLLYDKLNKTFQITFWLRFIFTRKYHNLPQEALEGLNKLGESKKNSNSISARTYRHALKHINKRNNYTPTNGDDKEQTKS